MIVRIKLLTLNNTSFGCVRVCVKLLPFFYFTEISLFFNAALFDKTLEFFS